MSERPATLRSFCVFNGMTSALGRSHAEGVRIIRLHHPQSAKLHALTVLVSELKLSFSHYVFSSWSTASSPSFHRPQCLTTSCRPSAMVAPRPVQRAEHGEENETIVIG